MSLTHAAVTETTVESAPLNLLAEWLGQWFDGREHAVGANLSRTVTFPKVAVRFGLNQPPPAQPLREGKAAADLADAYILVVMLPRGERADEMDCSLFSGRLVTSYALFNFWVNARAPGAGQSEYLAQTIAERLKAILTNPECRYPLAEKGVAQLQPTGPHWLTNTDYSRRMVACAAQIQYPVEFGNTVSDGPDAANPAAFYGEQSVVYFSEDPLIVGGYLLGEHRWTKRVQLAAARVTAWAPQTAAVVLELELGGVLTGLTLAIPVGTANTEVSADLDLGLREVNNAPARWRVVSAPDPENSAWHAAVTMRVRVQ